MIHYNNCPLCNSGKIVYQLSAKDYTVSQKQFEIWHCYDCTGRFTQDIPDSEAIGAYYASKNYISHSDTKKGIVNTLYHKVRNRTLGEKRKLLQRYTNKKTGSLLDLGCGTGAFLNTMKTAGWEVSGLEPDVTARVKAKELYGLDIASANVLYDLKPGAYDAITLWHVLEHVHELHPYLKQVESILNKDGKLFIAVPNYTSHDAKHYGESWAAWDVPRHLYHFSPQSMKQLLSTYNLKLEAIKPMWYDSFYVSMLSEQYKNNKGNMIKAGFIGWISNFKTRLKPDRCSSIIYIISKN